MKTIESTKELIRGVDDHKYVEVTALKLRYLIERLTNAEASNDILRNAQRNQAMGSAEMLKANCDTNEMLDLATNIMQQATERISELEAKLDEAEKQEPIYQCRQQFLGVSRADRFWTPWRDCDLEKFNQFKALTDHSYKYETRIVYAKPIPAQLDNCSICKGSKGGVKGNENRINGELVCD